MDKLAVGDAVIVRSQDEYNGETGIVNSLGKGGYCTIGVCMDAEGTTQWFEPEELEVLPAIRGAARYFTVKADTVEAYLGFGGSFCFTTKYVKVVRIGEEDARWQSGRIASGTNNISGGIYTTVAGALNDSNTVWYVEQQEKRGAQ